MITLHIESKYLRLQASPSCLRMLAMFFLGWPMRDDLRIVFAHYKIVSLEQQRGRR